jgi:hypothetical protein
MAMAPKVGCGAAGPKSGRHRGILQLCREALEFTAANLFQTPAMRCRRRLFIEKNRYAQLFADRRTNPLRQPNTVGHRRAGERHEWHDVDGAHSRMDAALLTQIDQRDRSRGKRHCRLFEHLRLSRERKDRSIVRSIGGAIEPADSGHVPDRVGQRVDDLEAGPVADVRN